jgi:predicted DNA-binding protein
MIKNKQLLIRMTEAEHQKLEAYASQKGWSMAQVIREYIKRLPHMG